MITEIADRFVDLGSELSLGVVARDRSLPLTFEATGLPAGTSINATTGRITGTPTETGSYDVTVTVTDAADKMGRLAFANGNGNGCCAAGSNGTNGATNGH